MEKLNDIEEKRKAYEKARKKTNKIVKDLIETLKYLIKINNAT